MTVNYCYSHTPSSDEGITIKGQDINQDYNYGWTGALETNAHIIILRLKGERKIQGKVKKVNKVITTRSRIQCDVCGRKWRSSMKHCGNCGNYLY
jgi:hypothetical protein